ncbi:MULTISPECIES: aminomethyl-transferring glycine dehydrogenase subunit GcvPA [Thalassospira]|jgi:glycine dehydrogenase subunit 1|uniref:aminomethyl-transferring glycine dehydrogenase subunit GcvPA n=1 Tax=Thalassospira TaxID=168934 RepID=UPI00080FA7C0|nr:MULTISPECIES: aminomethyl-transferring glycine dehydrogenase subunit GcvPA [Thalassospira]MAB32793.1 aminomethyl-transferring glycine dehydrogenase [Thalassospira sp.]MBA06010.1 aminomethyl-transferring glycine dehydrogenase [Thalassospira sp.]MCH2273938.1 aminomethyl-transferring glycine dehydrogenase subunit GcvPA [Thalassospira sp.]MDM7974729.1 aminomethyl-transferring glycine dehydrogenase subunit GcvPA [Thalassospira xiamenensis]OCK06317.1 glycine dehydrogenase (decarboxylating) subuni|tara:strand:+ start:1028 stop:2383 length:1356 start_codon:yes stop_codon:yes gene_type:complete
MRYLPLTKADRASMLETIGAKSVDELYSDVPEGALLSEPVDLPHHLGELQVERDMAKMAAKNMGTASVPSFLGAGAYRHHVPATVDYIIQRGEFLTAYTPYQPEIAQGTLQYLFEFQTQVASITGMDVANASMWDGATSCAEAVLMACRATRRKKAVLSGGLHPHYREVTETYCQYSDTEVAGRDGHPEKQATADELDDLIDDQTACVVVQYPDVFGRIQDHTKLADACHAKGALLIVVFTEAMAFGAVKSPGSFGADIVCGEGQSIGNNLNYGGPYVGLFATTSKLVRQMPGRLCGETVDQDGKRGFVLTLSTREQHIRREKATSNICTNSGLCSLAFTVHMSLLGEDGYRGVATLNHETACKTADAIDAVPGAEVVNDSFFNEFTVKLAKPAAEVVEALVAKGILGGVPLSRLYPNRDDLDHYMLVAATETNTDEDIADLASALKEVLA